VPGVRPAKDIAGAVIGLMAIAGAVLAVIGAFLPWVDSGLITANGVDFGPISRNGFHIGYLTDLANGSGGVDGLVLLIVGLAAAAIAIHYFFTRHAWASFAVVILGVGMYSLGLYNLVRIVHDARNDLNLSTGDALDLVGVGLYMCIAGGIVISLAAIAGTWRATRRSPQ
jgi:hypothetical protein